MGYKVVTPPTAYPVTPAELADHLRLFVDGEDLTPIIAAATELVEVETRRQLVTATWRLHLDAFPDDREIRLPKPPLQSVTSITYVDTAGVTQTFSAANYSVDYASVPGRVMLRSGASWPATDEVAGAVQVTFVAGYGLPRDVPFLLSQAVKLYAGHLYENREATAERTITAVPLALESIMSRYQVLEVP